MEVTHMALIDAYLEVIAAGVAVVRKLHAARHWYDSHDVVQWLSENRPKELCEMRRLYSGRDPISTMTQQVGKALYKCGQTKIGEHRSGRSLVVCGVSRDGECSVTKWKI